MLRNLKLGILFGVAIFFANTAEAASLFFVPATGEFGVGSKITVDLKIDSEGVGINAAQATIRFPKDTLTVTSVDKTDSTFNFWLEEPSFSNDDGVITFVGGTPYGISGASIQVLRVVFTSKGSGPASITIADAAITASDGSGTNVLSKTTDATFTISPTAVSTVIPAPTQIKREVVPASGLPTKPIVTVPLYPSVSGWHNVSNLFSASWELPRDISGVRTSLNKQPSFVPSEESEGLFENKTFNALSDGIWYLHVRFANNVGWGPTTHYRIAIDTQAPLPFEITSDTSEASDNPTPILNFKASDALSGLNEYRIKIDNENWIVVTSEDFTGSYKLPVQNPGKHHLIIRAVDHAGNSIENTIDYETLSITLPTFTFVTNTLYSDEPKGLTVRGTGIALAEVVATLKKDGATITSKIVAVDTQGNWEATFNDALRNGTYIVSIQSKDARGALSTPVISENIQVTGKYTGLIILSFIILVGSLASGFFYHKKRRDRTSLRLAVAESDVAKVFKMIEADVEKLKKADTTPTLADDEFIAQKLGENVKKMSGYIKETIKRAKE
ncbi:MAG: hypothetical protein UU88_C0018G0005 [Parcubacteria group bacterium GW2011_GWC1_42_11]|uniref:Cohesin domain-containing protein n=1 Tax=Candidatus Nomurabacteria bacterium GW2011_GWC2_42_20 TaxID=1618756 RepID=A0A0G0ZF76_9BACT|nr:MAG: hypothetical protein UU88_C0018G0005 [Parcubacteria group bacterium GW2011_GWC1_42_11]KKS47334.1 MAG: hypothetical protein UV12_C0008G0002 [Candidatus Nomurabacteria bacterium GW2011_GWC2_42_20]KKT09447.1 MAG: hypothetical protein UV86_C0007G0006 [Candidatus Nomurabacteria bacterium GW2011_GWB1_43_20]TAN36205.1 MAG: hypothetical protein EPN27_02195 [Patescibacteria group bacterium]HBH71547.1 hypothetical protein [Candidatus Yonathbacteria bacterium]